MRLIISFYQDFREHSEGSWAQFLIHALAEALVAAQPFLSFGAGMMTALHVMITSGGGQ